MSAVTAPKLSPRKRLDRPQARLSVLVNLLAFPRLFIVATRGG